MTLVLTDVLCKGCAHRVKYTNWYGMLMVVCSKEGDSLVLNTPMLECGHFEEVFICNNVL